MLHRLAYAGLSAVYIAMAIILTLEGALPHAICASVAALIYAALAIHPTAIRCRSNERDTQE